MTSSFSKFLQGTPGSDLPPLASLAFGLCALSLWMLLLPYLGVANDTVFYTMQGLAHLRPDLYGNDLFLRFGSQDQFTLFGRLYAWCIRLFGINHGASVMTLASQIALFWAAWNLARRLTNARAALLGTAALIVLNQPYGAHGLFHVLEPFATPRPLAQALVLWGTAMLMARRDVAAALLYAVAALIHPIMACAGFALMIWMRRVLPYWKSAATLGVLGIALLTAAARWLPAPGIHIDASWLDFIHRTVPYLELSSWSRNDWIRLLLPVATLAMGVVAFGRSDAGEFSGATLGVVITGTVVTLIGVDWLHLRYLTQAQPWRLQWLGEVVMTLTLPALWANLWQRGPLGRSAMTLILTAYCFQDAIYCAPIAALAIAISYLAARAPTSVPLRSQSMVLVGAYILLIGGATWSILNGLMSAHLPLETYPGPSYAAIARSFASGSLLGIALLVTAWRFSVQDARALSAGCVATVSAIAMTFLLPSTVSAWTRITYSPSAIDAFSPWRDQIPPGTEVLFTPSPLNAWIYLQRPSYITADQRASGIFRARPPWRSTVECVNMTWLTDWIATENSN
jgi:hypothetical protein